MENNRCFGKRVEQQADDRETARQLFIASMIESLHLDMVLLLDLLTRLDIAGRSMLCHRVDLGWQLRDC